MKKFLAVVGYLFLTLLAVVSAVWVARVPLAVTVCGAVKRNISPDECIKSVAVFLTQPALCERITGRDFKYENPPKMQCYTDVARKSNDVALCAKVNEPGLISESELSCLYWVAREHNNPAACAAITGSESRMGSVRDKAGCFKMISKTEADVASAPPKKTAAPIILGLSAGAISAIAYVALGIWLLWTIRGIARRRKKA